jgi:hypothetical protein
VGAIVPEKETLQAATADHPAEFRLVEPLVHACKLSKPLSLLGTTAITSSLSDTIDKSQATADPIIIVHVLTPRGPGRR